MISYIFTSRNNDILLATRNQCGWVMSPRFARVVGPTGSLFQNSNLIKFNEIFYTSLSILPFNFGFSVSTRQ